MTERSVAFPTLAGFLLILVLFGFSFTYWIPWLTGQVVFEGLLHVHAALWFGWFALLTTQACLANLGRLSWHRVLGITTVIYTAVLIYVSTDLAFARIARDAPTITGDLSAVPTIIPLTQIVMFSVCFIAAILLRRRTDVHKRLLILAALVGMTPALARISIGIFGEPIVPLLFLASSAFIVIVVVIDRRIHDAFHPVYVWGGVIIIGVRILRVPLAMSPAWKSFAAWIAGFVS